MTSFPPKDSAVIRLIVSVNGGRCETGPDYELESQQFVFNLSTHEDPQGAMLLALDSIANTMKHAVKEKFNG